MERSGYMPKIIWFNQPTNHSGYLNLLYLTPEGDVGREKAYTDVMTGYFIMGGPAIIEEYDDVTEAGKILLSFLDRGFHFYPPSSEEEIRKEVEEKKDEIPADLRRMYELFDELVVFSKDYSNAECLRMLVNGEEPASPIVFVDMADGGEEGLDILCQELARVYYHLPKEKREELGLKRDWHIPDNG
jgi:hypothetical protein